MSKLQSLATKPAVYAALLIPVFVLGILAGKMFTKKPVEKSQVPALQTATTSHYNHLNPFLESIAANAINMAELKTFRPKIDEYIRKVKAQNPDLHIAYYFRDLNNGMWIGINEQEEFSPASLMKVPLLACVLKEAQANPGFLQKQIIFEKKKFETVDEDSGIPKEDGKHYTILELLNHSVSYSDNAASLMLMDIVGMDKVIKTENDMNLSVDATEDFYSNFVKVKSYAGSFRILYNAAYLNREMSDLALSLLSNSVYNGGIRKVVPSNIMVAHKYGERDVFDVTGKRNTLQLHHFGIVYYPHKPFLVGIMTRGSTREIKEKIIADLADITYKEVDSQVKSGKQVMVNVNY